jgi:hypothetical protein
MSRRDPRYGFRDLFWDLPAWAIAAVIALGPFIVAPFVARYLDDHGLPGLLLVLPLLLLGPVVAIVALRRQRPDARRARQLRDVASDLGLRFEARFDMPHSMRDLPALNGSETWPGTDAWGVGLGVSDLVAGHVVRSAVVAFDFWTQGDGPYAQVHRRSLVAVATTLDAYSLIIEPRSDAPVVVPPNLIEVTTESSSFNDRFRVLTTDRRFASTVVDQRLMAWLLGSDGDWSYELGGRWAAIVGPLLAPPRLSEAIATVERFREHLPRVAGDLYPRPDPAV